MHMLACITIAVKHTLQCMNSAPRMQVSVTWQNTQG
jgi:hypothetical protein